MTTKPTLAHGAMPELPGLALARLFHETYERLAPQFGYTTRPETREFDPDSANGKLMTAVCAAIQQAAGVVPEGMRARELLAELVECVSIEPGERLKFLHFEKYSGHASDCPRPRGDQGCGCGYSAMRAGLDAHLDECTGYHNSAAIDKARAFLAASPSREAGSSDHLAACDGGGVTQWQPIETAPKDYGATLFDVWSRGARVADCWWGRPTYGDKAYGIVYQSGYDCDGPVNEIVPDASHWMLLPPPPAPRPDAPTSQIENLDKISTRHCGHPDHPGCEDCTPAPREDGHD